MDAGAGTPPPPLGSRVLLGGRHAATVRYVGPVDGQSGTWGPATELQQVLPGLAELDLSGNLISSWAFVAELAAALPGLHTLNLSGNRLALPSLAGGGATTAAGTDSMAAGMGAPSAAAAGSHSSAAEHQQQAQGSSEGGSGSKLPMPAAAAYSLPAGQPTSLAGIRTLVLNGCGASWQQAVAIAQQLPNLRELHLCNNGMASLQMPGTSSSEAGGKGSSGGEGAVATLAGLSLSPSAGSCSSASHSLCSISQLLAAAFPQLEVLDLEGNALSSWTELATLSTLPRLRSLLLSGNRLDDVQYSGGFTSLRSLLLGSNCLADWAAVDALNSFPALEEARLSDNPLTAAAPSSARYQCIARIRGLTVLNASAVSPAERWDAELNYLRLVTDELASAAAAAAAAGAGRDAAAAREAVLAANPRFGELTQKYGELTPAAPKAATGSALASSMAQLTVCHNGKTLTKKLPVSLTVGKLKLMLERLLRVKAAQQALLLVPPEASGAQPEDITDDDGRELRYYDVCDGCRLEVSTSDPAARAAALAAAKAAAAAAHAERMEQHEKTIQQFRAVEQRLMA
ncbi:hypothetical protein COHA_010532 [Chlorella ohadii]|uniref:Ubiquitin-like domain-containing protein n=1 Tax=Chlorella ohadii TaxID=2649997 RepID=A0AAD5DF79_9CHLO|nr:hypothetical protein COHA_010532 [Chlorella ohadii]